MANETTIANMALALIGSDLIASLGDTTTKKGRMANLFYEQARDEVFAEPGVEFRVAMDRAGPLAAATDEPSFGWDYAYTLPRGCMRVLCLLTGDGDDKDTPLNAEWKREGGYILTDESECYIKYVSYMTATDTANFRPMTVKAIATNLASKLAYSLKGDFELARALYQQYEAIDLVKAISSNNSEGFVEDETGSLRWDKAGRTSSDE